MIANRPPVDPQGLTEFSVVFTDRSLNSMSVSFQRIMRELHEGLCEVYGAAGVAIIPGGGTFGMEAVARQFAEGQKVMVVRNGWFSYRWSQIIEAGVPTEAVVICAQRAGNTPTSPFRPAPIEEVEARIAAEKPAVVFAPHVETSAGMILPDDYITRLAAAAHGVGALMVLDCIASGCAWVDMAATGVDVLISAPQKGWSSTPCAGLVMMSDRALARLDDTQSSSFVIDLKKWRQIMQAYLDGGHAYHATMPTDGLRMFREAMEETRQMGFAEAAEAQWALGNRVRQMFADRGLTSVAADGFGAPGVVVAYTDRPEVKTGKAFAERGVQIAAGVPLQVGEGDGFSTFRIGLFGLDKLTDIDATCARLEEVLDQVFA